VRRQLESQTGQVARAQRQVQLVLEDGSAHPLPGTLQFSGVTVDRGTGAVTLRAVVPNPKGSCCPAWW
jgi:membrane fusion protein (multidrug efflux system)